MTVTQDIYDGVVQGRVEDTVAAVETALAQQVPVNELLHDGLISAMDLVGVRFGEGEVFIPQVLWSAKAMQAGMALLKPHFADGAATDRASIVIGTAKGDIHDIGKTLVAMMLEGAGFEVFDLGVDVDPERFVDKAAEVDGDIIAVSALLTTTMQSMRDVVALLNERGLSSVKVLVGGAPVDEEFCREIGAHAYGFDAMDAVRKVRDLVSGQ